jgi:hypothetical protein
MDGLPGTLDLFGADWLGANISDPDSAALFSPTSSPIWDDWESLLATGGIAPGSGVNITTDSGIVLNIKTNVDFTIPYNPKHLMVKGFMNVYDLTVDDGWNACIGFMNIPYSGFQSEAFAFGGNPALNPGVYFAGGYNLPAPFASNPDNWHAVVCDGSTIYALDTGVPIEAVGPTGLSDNHKFHIRLQSFGAQFYIDNILVATVDISDPLVAAVWPDSQYDLWAGVGISNTSLARGSACYPMFFLPWISAAENPPDPSPIPP